MLLLAFFAVKLNILIGRTEPSISMTTLAVEPGPTDLFNYNFVFAVEKVDPRIGTIRVESVYWDKSIKK